MQESLMVTYINIAMEGRNVSIANIPGAFLQIDMVHADCILRVRICVVLEYRLVKVDPEKFSDKLVL